MPDDDIPAGRLARWAAVGALIVIAVALYFVHGRHVAPLAPTAASADSQPIR